jgi:hypothetical protein
MLVKTNLRLLHSPYVPLNALLPQLSSAGTAAVPRTY